jgi:NAD(P)-dependent dehydrogenase (short-subunit alcohol dehydrogenase family)
MIITLITGATRGLGRETARRLVDAGHSVYLGARDAARGAEAAAAVGATAIALDVTDDASIAAAADRVREEVGSLDVLVNNAGIAGDQRQPGKATITDLRRVLETNVVGAASVLSAFTPLLDSSSAPVVVNVSSAVGSLALNARPDAIWSMLAYPMSKAALNMLTIQYARAFPRWRVNSATPGLTATEFTPAPNAGHPVEKGAEILVRMATIGPDGPTGTFVGNDGPLPW